MSTSLPAYIGRIGLRLFTGHAGRSMMKAGPPLTHGLTYVPPWPISSGFQARPSQRRRMAGGTLGDAFSAASMRASRRSSGSKFGAFTATATGIPA
jgi:hypothetical protein